MKLISNGENDKLNLNNDEFDKKKKLRKGKGKAKAFRRGTWLLPFVKVIQALFLKNLSHQKIYTFWHSLVNDEVTSTSSQTVEQIEDITGGGIPGLSKMNDSALDKEQGDYTQFSPKKDSRKMEIDLLYPIIFAIPPVAISSVRKCSSCNTEKTSRVEKTRHKLRDETTKNCMNITNKESMNERM